MPAPVLGVKKGDQVATCVAAASIIAKVSRDKIMTTAARRYRGYGFQRHKGYGTDEHWAALRRLGPRPTIATPSPAATPWATDQEHQEEGVSMSAEDPERYEADMELQLYQEYRDVLGMFQYVIETERRFYLANKFDLQMRNEDGDTYFDITLHDAWVWDMYRPARFVTRVRVVTFKDVNIEELIRKEEL